MRTIYPPVAEVWFAGVYRVAGVGARHKAWQAAGLITELATLGLVVVALGRWGRDGRWAALYALCPAPALEIVNNGHVDGLAVALIVGALAVVAPSDRHSDRRYEVLAAALVAGAALVKLYPALLLLPLAVCRPGRRLSALLRAGGIAAALGALAYTPHVAAVGSKVVGYLPGYLKEESYQGGGRYLIASVLHVPHALTGFLSLLGVGAVAVWILLRRPPLLDGCAAILGAVLLASSPAQPWYAVALLALATLAARPAWAAVVVAGYAASLASVLDRADAPKIGGWAYAAALALVLVVAAMRSRRGRVPLVSEPVDGRP